MEGENKPEVEECYLAFLDNVRNTGKISMMGAGPYLAEYFNLPHKEANRILQYWMNTYSQRHSIQ